MTSHFRTLIEMGVFMHSILIDTWSVTHNLPTPIQAGTGYNRIIK